MKKTLTLILSILLVIGSFGCSKKEPDKNITSSVNEDKDQHETSQPSNDIEEKEEKIEDKEIGDEIFEMEAIIATDDEIEQVLDNDFESIDVKLNDEQMNSITMLNYLSVLIQNIFTSPNNRLVLEGSYATLYGNIFPNSVDKTTQNHITDLLTTISKLEMNDIKRNRIQYIYDQGQARAMKNAIPSPLSMLNVIQSNNPLKSMISVVSLALNSYSGYRSSVSENEMQYLQSDWEIQDNEKKFLDNAKVDAFNYLIDIVRENDLPGDLSIDSRSIEEYLEKVNSNNYERNLQFLETKQDVYKGYYGYWLFLSEMYYQTGNYKKCIDSFDYYESMNVNIFRKNHDLAKTLPSVICATQEVFEGNEQIEREEKYARMLMDNSASNEWALQYYAIQTYLDLYSKTSEMKYLNDAYTWTLTVVDELIDTQHKKNEEYLSELVLLNEKEGSKEDKHLAKEYNRIQKDNREKELPPVYEPLLLNCQLLFAISEKLNLSPTEKNKVDKILHQNGENLFLNDCIDNAFWMNKHEFNAFNVSLSKRIYSIDLIISANILSEDTKVVLKHNGVLYDDWKVKTVERNNGDSAEKFSVMYQSDSFNLANIKNGDLVEVIIDNGDDFAAITASFTVFDKSLFIQFETNSIEIK